MNKLIVVIHRLDIGGVQKSLIPFLNAIDYQNHEVTLYIRKNKLDLLDEIHPDVKVVINQFDKHHVHSLMRYVLAAMARLSGKFRLTALSRKADLRYSQWLAKKERSFELKHYPVLKEAYDTAISYIQGDNARFVQEVIRAEKKYMFWHGSTDENHSLHQIILSSFDAIIGVSQDVAEVLKGFYPEQAGKIRYITNFVDDKLLQSMAQKKTVEKAAGGLTLCSVGRFTPVKGFDLAIEAASILRERQIPFLWYFVGDGPERENLEAAVRKYNLKDNILFTGMQANPYPYMAACDFYVQPSREEAWPLTIREAKLLGKPVVTTATVGGKTQVTDGVNGLVTEITGGGLAEGIERLYKNKDELKLMETALAGENNEESRAVYTKAVNALLEGSLE